MKTTSQNFLLALACTAATACALTPAQRREENLVREARQANDDFRWGRYEQFAQSLPADEARLFMGRADSVGDELVMADFEIVTIKFSNTSDKANIIVKFDWYTKRTMTLRTTTLEQQWEYRNGHWLCAQQHRSRGDRFPLIPERVAPPPVDGKSSPPPAASPASTPSTP